MDSISTPYEVFRNEVRDAGYFRRAYIFYTVYALLVLCGIGLSLFLLTVSDSVWFQIGNAVFFSFVMIQAGMLGHDLSHGQVFGSRRANLIGAQFAWGLLGGLSATHWFSKHNAHHKEVNRIGHDPDLAIPFLFSEKQLASQSRLGRTLFLPMQQVLFFLFLPLIYPISTLGTLVYMVKHPTLRTVFDLLLVVIHFGIVLSLPLLFLPLPVALTFFIVHFFVAGLYMGLVFAPNHKGEAVRSEAEGTTWKDQIVSTRNITGGWISFIFFGALNLQIEHHLFPHMARPLYLKVQPLVREFCTREGLPYHETTLLGSLSEMYQALSWTKNLK